MSGAPRGGLKLDVLGVAGKEHKVEIATGPAGSTTVVVDGNVFEIRRDPGDTNKVFVGKPHTVEVKETDGSGVTVIVDGVSQRINLPESLMPPSARVSAKGLGAGAYRMLIGNADHEVELRNGGANGTTVVVDGATFQVERANAKTLLVNGKPHAVEVKERGASSAGVLVDGSPQTVQIVAKR